MKKLIAYEAERKKIATIEEIKSVLPGVRGCKRNGLRKVEEGSFAQVTFFFGITEDIAVKQLLYPDNNRDVQLFKNEVEILKGIRHKNIIKVIDSHVSGVPYVYMMVAMEESLQDLLGRKKIDYTRCVELFVGITDGVKYLHDHDIIHRDLYSGNILLDKKGVPKISDLGMSKRLRKPELIKDLILMISWYRAPELCSFYEGNVVICEEGSDPTQSRALDIFGLGAMWIEMICRFSLFKAVSGNQAIISEHMRVMEMIENVKGYKRDKLIVALNLASPNAIGISKGMLRVEYTREGGCNSKKRWNIAELQFVIRSECARLERVKKYLSDRDGERERVVDRNRKRL